MYGDHINRFKKEYLKMLFPKIDWLKEKGYTLKQVGNLYDAINSNIKIVISFGQYFEEAVVNINYMDGYIIKSQYNLSDLLNILSTKYLMTYLINNQLYKMQDGNEYNYNILPGDNYIKIIGLINFLYDYFEVLTEKDFIYNVDKILSDRAILQSKLMM